MKELAIKACLDNLSIRGDPDSSSGTTKLALFKGHLKVDANFSCRVVDL
jgi:hypothetical protein